MQCASARSNNRRDSCRFRSRWGPLYVKVLAASLNLLYMALSTVYGFVSSYESSGNEAGISLNYSGSASGQ